ncbi:MAG: 4-hydroxy-tetrahydrodipicolinate synthase [Candidatus Anoxychlamydiales bacterium]|nr:4-hydroxy-tetrahydrodipicolinate synthase [Candidatus Anoxychlamydiales bacterium]
MKYTGSMVALVTPFNLDGSLDIRALENLINWHIECKTDAIVLCGTTAEAPTLEEEERFKIFETAVRIAKNKIKIIAGTGTYSTKKSVYFTKKALDIGISACLVVVPYYNKPSFLGLYKHFEVISKVGLDVILYYHPNRTGLSLTINDFIELQNIEKIVAVKEASGNLEFIKKIINETRFGVLSGDDPLTYDVLKNNGCGVISVVANIIPDIWKKYIDLLLNKKFIEAKLIYLKYQDLINVMFLESNPICVKYSLSLMSKCKSKMRLPLIEPTEINRSKIYNCLVENNLLQTNRVKV